MIVLASYQQNYTPLAHSLGWSALVAAIPLLGLFLLLGVLRMKAWQAGLLGLLAAFLVAIVIYKMPVITAFAAATQGAAFGAFPAMWIVVNAIWVYQLTVRTGHFDVLRRSFASVSADQRVQAIIIAFCFGALMEALAGFGTPVAITAVMLIGLGFKPLKAATVALVANTAPVAFGAVALPIVTLAKVTGLPQNALASHVAVQTPVLAVFVPLALVFIVDGKRGVRETWLPALVTGVAFAVASYLMATYGPIALTDIAAALVSAGALILLLRVWRPSTVRAGDAPGPDETTSPEHGRAEAGSTVSGSAQDGHTLTARRPPVLTQDRRNVLLAYFPYALIVVVFSIVNIPAVKSALDTLTVSVKWPGLSIVSDKGVPSTISTYKFDWVSDIGSLLFVIGIITAVVLRIGLKDAVRSYGDTLIQLRTAIVTVLAVLALAFVMNASGQTVTLGLFLAQAGGLFALLSPLLGWFGTAVTGSDTSSNALFGTLQVSAAKGIGLNPLLTAAANSSGGVLGKMISPQNLAVGAAAVGLSGREGELFRRVFVWTVAFLIFMCVLVYLQSTPVLSWVLP